jgi:hypothetical protein
VTNNFLQALLAIMLGNLAYFLLSAHRLLPPHRTFQMNTGLIVDFLLATPISVDPPGRFQKVIALERRFPRVTFGTFAGVLFALPYP